TATVSVTVNDESITANGTSITTTENTATTGTLTATDTLDSDATFTATTFATAHGSVTIASDGSYTYTPNTGYLGTDSFTFTAVDETSTSTATVRVTGNNASRPPKWLVRPHHREHGDDGDADGDRYARQRRHLHGDDVCHRAWVGDDRQRRQLHLHAEHRLSRHR